MVTAKPAEEKRKAIYKYALTNTVKGKRHKSIFENANRRTK